MTASVSIDLARKYVRPLNWLLETNPSFAEQIAQRVNSPVDVDALWADICSLSQQKGDGVEDWATALRVLRRQVWATIAVRDLNDAASLDEVTSGMSRLADLSIEVAVQRLQEQLAERFGYPEGRQGLIVMAMGKLGGRELNVSSDIDLIFLYEKEGATDGARSLDHFDYFNRLAPLLIRALSDSTDEGPLFRVDMRLRPHGDSGPMVCSLDMLEEYFIAQGRAWERCAWIKARSVLAAAEQQVRAIAHPFVYRKYLDYSALESLRQLHQQIRYKARGQEDHVKLGPGGIREIEFIAQVFQLIRGGRDPALQDRRTMIVLERLGERGVLSPAIARDLQDAYVFLRRVEHRLQYREDAQTHTLPPPGEMREQIAHSLNFASVDEFDRHHRAVRALVTQQFDSIFSAPEHAHQPEESLWQGNDGEEEPTDRARTLAALGFGKSEETARLLQTLRKSSRYRTLNGESQHRFDVLVPQFIHSAAAMDNPDRVLARVLGILEHICHRGSYLAMLHEYPQALRRVVEICASSSWAVTYLERYPLLLDELLAPDSLQGEPDWEAFRSSLESAMTHTQADVEAQMNQMRELRRGQEFHLLLRDLAGQLTVESLADHLSLLADIILASVLQWTASRLEIAHPRFAVIGYGKLGGKELGYVSDLDLVFIFEDEAPEALERYSRLAQRINSWLSTPTIAGVLYATDLRLRPDGSAGLWAQSLTGLDRYLRHSAWVWEHQALSRARYCAGDAGVGKKFEALRHDILCLARDPEDLRRDILNMRRKMHAARPTHQGFDVKHSTGGLIDVEFIVQYLVLAHAHRYPQLTKNLGNIALLNLSATLGLIPQLLAEKVADRYRELRHLQHRQRLNEEEIVAAPNAQTVAAIRDISELWQQVFSELA